ncbi:membrane-associating domain-containing protein [Pyronema domesticum]|uniref:Similar to Pc20g05640 [Penicillium chrysogenum Wisconsin 54-1255] acc. no. XP_002563098 n=1 Tax=Pyronema omphalodes (strain CBS 100304) TaxID=1076935 RepID=U4KWD2_PYROM|nr:membrane-associating domain-containing protein [Pyronema domesticum]CCX05401.1 Similar to Pc20g05640 [Penicillium chrysogenum Wisconsin 54-1255]; acc. no. XP_002563098 [Pyronema omphalodes CBS 100304]
MRIFESLTRLLHLGFTTIALGLCGALLQQQYHGGTPTRLNYSIFALALSALSLFYLLPALFIERIRNPIAVITLDVLNFIFLFCAGIAMAAQLGGKGCGDRNHWRNGILNGGGYNPEKRCKEANALTAFLWFAATTAAISGIVAFYNMKKELDTRRLHSRRPNMKMTV